MKKLFLWLGLVLSFSAYADGWSSYTIPINQHKLHYYQSGRGDAIFLLTGYATTSNFWNKNFVDCLAKNHTVYLVDYWGINTEENVSGDRSIQKMADDVFMLSKALHVKAPVFIGWSMGGAVAQQIGFNHADEVGKIVLIAPLTIHNQPQDDVDNDEIVKPLRTQNDVLNYVFENNLYNYQPKQLSFYKHGLFDINDKLFPNTRISNNQVFAINMWTSDAQTLELAKTAQADYLFLVPLQDKMLLPEQTLRDAKLFPHAKVVKFDGSGHNISMQAPNQVCKIVDDFVE